MLQSFLLFCIFARFSLGIRVEISLDQNRTNVRCGTEEYRCPDGYCIPADWHCDGEKDCRDGFDELDSCGILPKRRSVPLINGEDSFHCLDGTRRISKQFFCDGNFDCPDRSDEKNCTASTNCGLNERICHDNSRCIPETWLCDGEKDCDDGSDEKNCGAKKCPPALFSCGNGIHCIPKGFVCDGSKDCPNGIDENGCHSEEIPHSCRLNEFHCGDGSCVSNEVVCDSKPNCANGMDEKVCDPKQCEGAANFCQVGQKCRPSPSGTPICLCPSGTIQLANKTCSDINECVNGSRLCSQKCVNTFGSYHCECLAGYRLEPDQISCKAEQGNPVLFYTESSSIRAYYARDERLVPVAKNLRIPIGITFDAGQDRIFWTETQQPAVKSAYLSQQKMNDGAITVLNKGLIRPEGIAWDWITQILYITDLKTRQIMACKIDGKIECTTVIRSQGKLRALALYPEKGLMFWTDWSEAYPGVERAGMDGSDRSTIITEKIAWPNGITIDYPLNKLYWTDGKMDKIERCNLDGSGREVVLEGIPHPFSIQVFENRIYWSDWSANVIESALKINGKDRKVIIKDRTLPSGLYVYHPYMQKLTVANPCAFNNCSHNCLLNPHGGYTCGCPEHYRLSNDSRTCRMTKCSTGYFQCGPDAEECVLGSWVCDGTADCRNGADEKDCSTHNRCQSDEIRCANGRCIGLQLKCDGLDDCGDGTDEKGCDRHEIAGKIRCSGNAYRCALGPCISIQARCDGVQDCPRGDDESNCAKNRTGCAESQFSCDTNEQCIPKDWVCDRQSDCRDGSDEKNCDYTTTSVLPPTARWKTTKASISSQVRTTASEIFKPCTSAQFACKNGNCIDRVRLCDKHPDCPGGEDEGEFCRLCDRYGCQHECEPTPHGPICRCQSGYRLTEGGKNCIDINECEERENICDQGCENIFGSFLCSCAPGYELESDGRTCKLVQQTGHIMFSVGREIRNMPLFSYPGHEDSYGVMTEVQTGYLTGLDYNWAIRHYFFTEHELGEIYKADPIPKCLISGLFKPQAVVVDWITENLYYTNNQPASIGFCRSDGRYCKTLFVEGLIRPRGIAVHPAKGIMFWSDWGGDQSLIHRANMDGSEEYQLVNEKIVWPNGLAIDYVHGRLFWVDANLHLIESCDFNGGQRQIVLSKGIHHPFDLAVFDHRVFWSDWEIRGILMADLRNATGTRRVLHSTSNIPFSITITHPAYQNTEIPNTCEKMKCEYLCALIPGGARCLCPDMYEPERNFSTGACLPKQGFNSKLYGKELPGMCVDRFERLCLSSGDEGPCKNGGDCEIEKSASQQLQFVSCKCPPSFTGIYCEIPRSSLASDDSGTPGHVKVSGMFGDEDMSRRSGDETRAHLVDSRMPGHVADSQRSYRWVAGCLLSAFILVIFAGIAVYAVRMRIFDFEKPKLKSLHRTFWFRHSLMSENDAIMPEKQAELLKKTLDAENGELQSPKPQVLESFDSPYHSLGNPECQSPAGLQQTLLMLLSASPPNEEAKDLVETNFSQSTGSCCSDGAIDPGADYSPSASPKDFRKPMDC